MAVINDISWALNNQVLSVLPGDEVVYGALDKICDDPQDQLKYPEEFLNSLTPTGMLLHKFHLKIGCIIMFLETWLHLKDCIMEQD